MGSEAFCFLARL